MSGLKRKNRNSIRIVDRNTDRVIGMLNNRGSKIFTDDLHIHDLETKENSFRFTMPATIKEAAHFEEIVSVVIPKEQGGLAEFIVFRSQKVGRWQDVISVASYTDIESQAVIPAGTYTGNLLELATIALEGTDHDVGEVEFVGDRTLILEESVGPYTFIMRLATLFDVEFDGTIRFSGPRVTGRTLNFYKQLGRKGKKEIVRGKDLLSIERIVNNQEIVTALHVEGPVREDGTRLTAFVSDDDAFQRWGLKGEHRIAIYRPESSDQEMTMDRLIQLGEMELKKRVNSIFDYIIEHVDISSLFPHERLWIGDTCRVVDTEFSPPLYAEARAKRVERSLVDNSKKKVKIGEVVLYSQETIQSLRTKLQAIFNNRIEKLNRSKNATHFTIEKPDLEISVHGDIWVSLSEGNKIYNFDEDTGDYEPKKLEPSALSISKVSDVTDNLGTVRFGEIIGVRIRSENPSNGWVELDFGQLFTADNDDNYAQLNGKRLWFGNGPGNPFTGDGIDTTFFLEVDADQNEVLISKHFKTNSMETGWMAGSCINAAAVENGSLNGVNFTVKKTYVPSSIAFTSVNSNATPNFYDINVNGFTFGVPSLGANTLKFIRGYYTA